jgi:aralkylamine N-acetyltransferase
MSLNHDFYLSSDICNIPWQRLADVFEQAPLGKRDPLVLEQLFRNSSVCCFAYYEGQLIGAGRALSDQINYAFILDVVILPKHQGKGYGRQLMNFIAKSSKASNMVLHAVPEMQNFYAKLGYRKMTTAMALFADPEYWHKNYYIE